MDTVPVAPSDLDYDLPKEAIAQVPVAVRDQARLLVDHGDRMDHRQVRDLPELVGSGDVVVVNDTRVLPARLRLRRSTGGAVEVLLLCARPGGEWEALVRPSRRLRVGEIVTPVTANTLTTDDVTADTVTGRALTAGGVTGDTSTAGGVTGRALTGGGVTGGALTAGEVTGRALTGGGVTADTAAMTSADERTAAVEIGVDLGEGRRLVRVHTAGRELLDFLSETGTAPLPPYITAGIDDPERYQTVYSRRPLSAAAPTAGLHFTERLMARVREAGARIAAVELVIGLDTFRPVTAARFEDHRIHTEQYSVPAEAQESLAQAERVVAIGTTVARCLETWAATGEPEGHSDLFIRRPYQWKMIDALLTNFHLPRSSLLCLLDAFIGSRWRAIYATALAKGYRFLSLGDAMFATRRPGST